MSRTISGIETGRSCAIARWRIGREAGGGPQEGKEMIRHGQEVLEVFEIEKADLRFDDHVDRRHREQLLQDDKERTLIQ